MSALLCRNKTIEKVMNSGVSAKTSVRETKKERKKMRDTEGRYGKKRDYMTTIGHWYM